MLKTTFALLAPSLALLLAPAARAEVTPAAAARADIQRTLGFVPEFVKALPEVTLPGYWAEVKNFEISSSTALSGKTKSLISLAVGAQSGSRPLIAAYNRCSRASGASEAEVSEAIAIAGLVRRFSTFMNGVQLDETRFRADIAQLVANVTKAAQAKQAPPAPIAVVDDQTALADVKQTFGFVPDFMKRAPAGTWGSWVQMRDLELAPTALPGKVKTLISVAVAAQVPCRYCLIADTQFAKLEGATDEEIAEAVTMAGMARNFGALLDGAEVSEATVRRDFDRLAAASKTARMARKSK